MAQGKAKPGQSPAWILEDPTSKDTEQVETFLTKYASRDTDSGRVNVRLPRRTRSDKRTR